MIQNPPDLNDARHVLSRLQRYVFIGMAECDSSRVGG